MKEESYESMLSHNFTLTNDTKKRLVEKWERLVVTVITSIVTTDCNKKPLTCTHICVSNSFTELHIHIPSTTDEIHSFLVG